MWPFSRKSRRQLGIDIGTSSIKIVELEHSGDHMTLINYGIAEGLDFFGELLPNSNAPSTLKMSDNDIAAVLRQILDATKIKTDEVVMSIPIFSSFLTVMELPPMSNKELENAVPFEARSYIPVPLAEVVLDWLIIPPRQETATPEKKSADQPSEDVVDQIAPLAQDKLSVLLIAVPKEVVSKYQRIAVAAKLKLLALESESFSLARSLIGNDPSAILMVDFAARNTNLTVVDKGFIRLSHSADLSGKEMTKIIAHGLNITPARADELKRTAGISSLGSNKGVAEILTPFLDRLTNEIERMITLYWRKENQKIEKMVLTGGSASMPGLTDYLSKRMNIQLVAGNPFSRIKFDPALTPLSKSELVTTLAVTIGLAMREL